jgi:D-amino-acid dehydrogenase
MTTTPDVLIVGGGAIGVATAFELARRGRDVVLLEARETVGVECSYGNAGLVSPSHCIPLARPGLLRRVPGWLRPGGAVYVQPRPSLDFVRFGIELVRSSSNQRMIAGLRALRDLTRASRDLFEDLTRDGMDVGYRRNGLMNVCATAAAFEELRADAELLRSEGFAPEVLGPEQACRREPCLHPDVAGAVFWSEDAHCDPGRYVAAAAEAAERLGAQMQAGIRVTGFHQGADASITAVQTNVETYRPRTVVLAAGAWTPWVARLAGIRVPIEAAKGYHVQLRNGGPTLQLPLIFQESVFAATPLDTGLRLAGTMEFVGMNQQLAQRRAVRLLEEARGYLAGLDAPGEFATWCGLRPFTPDNLPIVGSSTRVPNLLLAAGHSMLGITLAPVTGRAVADLVVDGSSGLPLDPLSPARYRA